MPCGNEMTAAIWWIASYPKSGSTWVRAVLATLLSGRPVDINAMRFLGGIASRRDSFDNALGVASANLSSDQITNLRPRAYEIWGDETSRPLFCKVHDAYALTPAGEPLFPSSASLGAVCVVRDPRAVALSFAHHAAISLDSAITDMNDPENAISASDAQLPIQLPQKLGRWSDHIEGWLAVPFPVHVLRYEDMISTPREAFSDLAQFLGLPLAGHMIDTAIEASSFSRLQLQEREHGFREKPRKAKTFFREGTADGWRRVLTREQADRIVANHGPMMARLGYDTAIAPSIVQIAKATACGSCSES
jgi:aryl sulfotransferase